MRPIEMDASPTQSPQAHSFGSLFLLLRYWMQSVLQVDDNANCRALVVVATTASLSRIVVRVHSIHCTVSGSSNGFDLKLEVAGVGLSASMIEEATPQQKSPAVAEFVPTTSSNAGMSHVTPRTLQPRMAAPSDAFCTAASPHW